MSLRPGIGAVALTPVISALRPLNRTVPYGLRNGDRIHPLGRYLRSQVARTLADGSSSDEKDLLGVADTVSKNVSKVSLLRAYASQNQISVVEAYKKVLDLPVSISTDRQNGRGFKEIGRV
jgi:hypothetical protein